MSDAWETLTANATDTSDAWAALNSQQTSSGTPGTAVNEIPFSLSGVTELSFVASSLELTCSTETKYISSEITVTQATASVEPEQITILEGC